MSDETLAVSFVGQKISKTLWCDVKGNLASNTSFVTGGWGDRINTVTKWHLSTGINTEPVKTSQVPVQGSVTDLTFMSPEKLLCSSSYGHVFMISLRNDILTMERTWSKLHHYKATKENASCNCVISQGHELITGGEDGQINILMCDRNKPVRVLEKADSSNITGLQYISANEIVSVNSTGQAKLWDIRQYEQDKPQKVLSLAGNTCPLLSVDKHPNQPHIVVTGHGDGVVGIWDIRQETAPVTLIDAHEAEVWQVKFHPLYPDNMFTCSQDGSCWFWDGTLMMNQADSMKTSSNSAWLYVDANKHKMETFSLIPFNKSAINTFDVAGSSLVCGTDSEALIVVRDIPVR